jgi:hypothetical protein
MPTNPNNILAVRNESQRRLFEDELKGQLSDGMWENVAGDHWIAWCDATVVVDPDNVGRNFYARKDNYNFNSSALLDCIGDRMLAMLPAGSTMRDLRSELKDLKVIVRTRRADVPVPSVGRAEWATDDRPTLFPGEHCNERVVSAAEKARRRASIATAIASFQVGM